MKSYVSSGDGSGVGGGSGGGWFFIFVQSTPFAGYDIVDHVPDSL